MAGELNIKEKELIMASPAQLTANQANAQKSTGPKTEEGKNKSKLNAWRHGLTGQAVVMPAEELQAYLAFRKALEARLQPADALESQIAGRMIDIQWRLNRCFSLENAVYALGHVETPGEIRCSDSHMHGLMTAARVLRDQESTMRTLGMHEQRLSRMYERARAELAKQDWDPAENGF